jgi:hypothetical protein
MRSLPVIARRLPRALVVPLSACAMALVGTAAIAGCGGPDRPAPLGDYVGTRFAPDGAAQPPIDLSGAPHVPMCNLGPNGGVCACSDAPLVIDPPTIYYVLDRSGSMSEFNKWGNIQSVLGDLFIALGPRVSVGAAVFPDPAFDQCAVGVEVFPPRRGDMPAGTAGPVEASLFNTLRFILAAGGTPTAATLTSLLPKLKAIPGKTYVVLATDGGPNCNSSASCGADQCIANIENAPGCSPTSPSCCTNPNTGGPQDCLDGQPSIDAVKAIASAGIPVYVVGVPGSAPYASLLDQMALAGGTARGSEPQYYAIDTADQAAFLASLSKIAAKITGNCTLDLGTIPPDPSLVNVFFDEKPIPQSGPDGWTLDGSSVTILGASCQKVLDGTVLDVRVVAGCPTVTL